jgi:hypothetical protein
MLFVNVLESLLSVSSMPAAPQGDSQSALDLSLEALNMRKACLISAGRKQSTSTSTGEGGVDKDAGAVDKDNELVSAGDAPELELLQDFLQSLQVCACWNLPILRNLK